MLTTAQELHVAKFKFSFWLAPGALSARVKQRIAKYGGSLRELEGRVSVGFSRPAPTLREAVLSALEDLQKAKVVVDQIGISDFVSAAEIARRTGRTRANICQLISSVRGPGAFPKFVAMAGSSPLWYWEDVDKWFAEYEGRKCESEAKANEELRQLNLFLQVLREFPKARERRQLMKQLEAVV